MLTLMHDGWKQMLQKTASPAHLRPLGGVPPKQPLLLIDVRCPRSITLQPRLQLPPVVRVLRLRARDRVHSEVQEQGHNQAHMYCSYQGNDRHHDKLSA